jgi:hypothetical protein
MNDQQPADDGTNDATETPTPAKPKVTRARATTVGKPTRPRTTPVASEVAAPDAAAVPSAIAVLDDPAVEATQETPESGPLRDLTITQGGLESAKAQTISITQGGIGQAEGGAIDVTQGGIGRAQATDIAVSQGGIGLARGEHVSLEMGAMGIAVAGEARVQQAYVRSVLAREARVEQTAVGTMAAMHVTIERTTAVGILIARQVDGSVRPLLDWRGALALGAGLGLLLGILRRR